MNRKKTLFNLTIVILLSASVIYFIVREDFSGTLKVLEAAQWEYIVLALAVYSFGVLVNTKILNTWIRLVEPGFRYMKTLKANILSMFTRNISPMQAGGQPMMVYVLNQYGVSIDNSVFILSVDFLVYQVTQTLFSLFWILFFLPQFYGNQLLYYTVLIGFLMSSALLVVLFVLVMSPRVHRFITSVLLVILKRLRIIKNPEALYEKIEQKIDAFASQVRYLKSQKMRVAKVIALTFVVLLMTHSIPFILAHALSVPLTFHDFWLFVAMSVFISNANALIITPGGTGGLEVFYMMVFGYFIHDAATIRSYMILWRSVTYYMSIIVGIILFIRFTFEKNLLKKASA